MSKTLFDHLNAIYLNQTPEYFDSLDESEQKTFNVYMVNRFLSMNMAYVHVVNEFQQYYESVGSRETYLFYSSIIPKRRQFARYIKATKNSSHEQWLVELIAKHYQISQSEAAEYLTLFSNTPEGKEALTKLVGMYGIGQKRS